MGNNLIRAYSVFAFVLWLSLGSNQYSTGRVNDVCLFYDGSTRRLN